MMATDVEAGYWVPSYYGNKFKASRLLDDATRTQVDSVEKFRTLEEARAECDRRNAEGGAK